MSEIKMFDLGYKPEFLVIIIIKIKQRKCDPLNVYTEALSFHSNETARVYTFRGSVLVLFQSD